MRPIRGEVLVLLSLAMLATGGCQGARAPRVGDWVAGDGAYPVDLPDGRVAWLFGDSLIRKPDGNDQLVHSSIVVEPENGGPITTIHGGTDDNPIDLISPAGPETVILPGAGFVEGNTLQIFAEEVSTAWGGFHLTGRRFQVGLSLPELRMTGRREIYHLPCTLRARRQPWPMAVLGRSRVPGEPARRGAATGT